MNRAERRAEEHGRDRGEHVQDNLLPQSANQQGAPIHGAETPEGMQEATAGDTELTGPGAGGAIESDGRLLNHEGMHLGNGPNS
ncbi:hypothetical protein BH20CHL6_BH20CHL6_03590 [soil metagenome]